MRRGATTHLRSRAGLTLGLSSVFRCFTAAPALADVAVNIN